MWSNAAQRNRNEAETEQSVGKAPCLTLPPPNEAKRSRKRSSDEAELPKSGPSLPLRRACVIPGVRLLADHYHDEPRPSNHSPRAASFVTSFVLLDHHHGERSKTEQFYDGS